MFRQEKFDESEALKLEHLSDRPILVVCQISFGKPLDKDGISNYI